MVEITSSFGRPDHALGRRATAAAQQVSPVTCPGQHPVTCGNGAEGLGFPGERQVNDPFQDAIAPDRNITQSETSLAHFGSFVLMGFNDSNCARGDNFSGFAFSSDGGVTWSDCGSMPLNEGWSNGGDPSVAVDSKGVFYYGHLGDNATGESIIQLNTATVDANRRLHMNTGIQVGVGNFPNGFQDKEWVAVGPDPARPGQESVYVTWTDFTPSPPSNNDHIRFTKLTTGVNPTVLIPPKNIVNTVRFGVQGSIPMVDQSGNLYVLYEDVPAAPPRTMRIVKSTDGGQTFTAPIIISDFVSGSTNVVRCDNQNRNVILVAPGKAIRQLDFPMGTIGPDGSVWAVWNDGRNLASTGHIDIFLAYSLNGGSTWTRVQVTNGPTHAFFPSVAVDAAGAHIQYSKFCGPGSGVGAGTFALFKRHFTIAGGLSPEEMVSTVCSEVPDNQPFNFDDRVAGCYMADYNQMITGDFGALLHAWGDNRHDPRGDNPDVFFIQQGGLPPSQVECILVDKVYDFCFEEDTGLQHCFAIPEPCANPPADFTANPLIETVTCVAGLPIPTGVDGLSTVRVTITATYQVDIRRPDRTLFCRLSGNTFTFTKTVTVCGPAGTAADCEVRAATTGASVILPGTPAFPTGQICTEFNFCVLVETTAPVKLLVPSFGFCTPARCQTGGFPPGVCPPSPLFPPQCTLVG